MKLAGGIVMLVALLLFAVSFSDAGKPDTVRMVFASLMLVQVAVTLYGFGAVIDAIGRNRP